MARYKLQGIARDGAGNIITDASVSVYLAGTTTAASVYEASSGGTAVNSVDTDDEGFYELYVDSIDYPLSQNFKITISKSGYTSKTFDEIDIFPGLPDYEIDVSSIYGNGSKNATILNTAITAVGIIDKMIFVLYPGVWTIDTDVTVPSNITLKIPSGALLQISTGVTLTISGSFESGLYQVFDCVGTGAVSFGNGGVSEVYPEWWQKNTIPGTTNMTDAIQAAIDSSNGGGIVKLQNESYGVNNLSFSIEGVTLEGAGEGSNCTELISLSAVEMLSLDQRYTIIKRLKLQGNSIGTIGIKIDFGRIVVENLCILGFTTAGIYTNISIYNTFKNCLVSKNQVGLIILSRSVENPSNFCTTTVFDGCSFTTNIEEGVLIDGTFVATLKFKDTGFEGNGKEGLKITNSNTPTNTGNHSIIFDACYIEYNSTGGVTDSEITIGAVGSTAVYAASNHVFFNETFIAVDVSDHGIKIESPGTYHIYGCYHSGSTSAVKVEYSALFTNDEKVRIYSDNSLYFSTDNEEDTEVRIPEGVVTSYRGISDGDTTPYIGLGTLYYTNNTGATTVTDFSGGYNGKIVKIIITDDNTTFAFSGATLQGNGGLDWTAKSGDQLEVVYINGVWYCNPQSNYYPSSFTIRTTNSAGLDNVTNGINTANKYAGKIVFNVTTSKYVQASGGAAADDWYDLDGSVAHSPS